MNCDGVRGLLSAYVDGELTAGELLRVEQHLRRCHWCADEVDALRQTIALVASLEQVEVPAAFHAQLHERLVALGPSLKAVRTAPAHHAKRQDFRRWAVPAAAAAALVISVAGYSRFTPPVPSSPAQVVSPNASAPTGAKPAPADTAKNGGQTAATNPTNSTNPVQDQSGQSKSSTANPSQQNPGNTVASNTSNPADPSGAKTQLGETSNKPGLHTATPSFLTDLSEPTSLPTQKRLGAAFEASVADPAAVAAALKAHFGTGAVTAAKSTNGVISLQLTLPAASFGSELAFVQNLTGATPADTSQELSAQIKDAYEALTSLDKQRAEQDKLLAATTDPKTLEVGRLTLAQLAADAQKAREAYQTLIDQVANGTITVTLSPRKAQ